jgi:hypothetical protein
MRCQDKPLAENEPVARPTPFHRKSAKWQQGGKPTRNGPTVCAMAAVLTAAMAGPLPAKAADDQAWACTLLLCFANPNGPMAVAACVPPVKKLLAEMSRFWRAFRPPVCMTAADKGSRVAYLHPSYDACPDGTEALQAGVRVRVVNAPQAEVLLAMDARMTVGRQLGDLPLADTGLWYQTPLVGIGDGDEELRTAVHAERDPRVKTCVGSPLGAAMLPVRSEDERGRWSDTVDIVAMTYLFETVRYVQPPKGRLNFQVFIDHKPYRSGSVP